MFSKNIQDQARGFLDVAAKAQPQFASDGTFMRIKQGGNDFSFFKQPRQVISSSTIRNR